MNDGEALLAAILANPDDDTPRLVYADWLQEHDDAERAEFIRVGVRRTNRLKDTPEYRELFGRELELLTRHREAWSAPLASWASFENLVFRRGFVEEIHLRPDVYLAQSEELLRATPLREVWVNNAAPLILELARVPRPRHVRLRAGDHSPPSSWFPGEEPVDLLHPSPRSSEPFLKQGLWLILCFSTVVDGDVTVAREFITQLHQRYDTGMQGWNFAVRPLAQVRDLRTWCPPSCPLTTPLWLVLQNGEFAETRVGGNPLNELRSSWPRGLL